MAFCIYLNSKRYLPEAFLAEKHSQPHLAEVARLLNCWQSHTDFNFQSSGSTGEPRNFVFSKEQVKQSAEITIRALGLIPEQEHILLCLDPKFVGGAMMVIRAILLDCPLTILEPRTISWEQMPAQHPYTFASFVPAQLQSSSFDKAKFERIRKVLLGGSAIPESLMQLVSNCSNRVFHTYGMTETLSHIALKHMPADKGFHCIPPFSVRTGEQGRLIITSPYQKEELLTNDCGEIWTDGSFVVLGRLDTVINSGGIKLHPEQLELLIGKLPQIPASESWMIAPAPHSQWGQEAVIVSETSWENELLQQMMEFLKVNGYPKAYPRRQVLLNPIPRSASGKPLRRKVAEWLENEAN